jgi:hypothetical protein
MSSYNPFTRDEDREAEARSEARRAHEQWSFEQSRKGQTAENRDGAVWLPRKEDGWVTYG